MTTCSSRSEEALGPLPSPVRGLLWVRRPSTQPEFRMVTRPGPCSEAAPFLRVYCRRETGKPVRLGGLVPHPSPAPLASFTLQKGMYESPSPATSHISSGPSACRHIGFQMFPTHFLPIPSRVSAPDEALECRTLGFSDRAGGGKAPKMADLATLSLHPLGQFIQPQTMAL